MKRISLFLILSLFVISGALAGTDNKKLTKAQIETAYQVINRFTGNNNVVLKALKTDGGNGAFSQEVNRGRLTVKGNTPVALCHGFYDWVRNNEYGINSWTGNRCDIPQSISSSKTRNITSPFLHHYYFNVVTFGYTMPYWDWNRWEKEIDWMALHGIDMPLALVANEAISYRVFKKLGLTDKEIGNFFSGPAHLPWLRMGNLSHIDGPLTQEWQNSQIKLQHQILSRMRSLGMSPICPGFAGFVPKEIKRLYPNVNLSEMSWHGDVFHNWMLSPEDTLFHKIGVMFIKEWEKEFGKCDYYLADSFNEMKIPFPPKDDPKRYSMLASYGKTVYNSIHDGDPDAVWVMQGWMFGYQRDIWDEKTLGALVSKVPDDKLLLLDLAVDYNKCFWGGKFNWDYYKGFFGKKWVYSVIPNMGGKSAMTGLLSFYANGQLEALHSPNKGNLVAFGMAPEGIENNEVIYELLSDAGWSDKNIDLDAWLENYSKCRYDSCPSEIKTYWSEMQKSVYGTFSAHPRFNWHFRPGLVKHGDVSGVNQHFYNGVEQLRNIAPGMRGNKFFEYDFSELAAFYAGCKVETLACRIDTAYQKGDTLMADSLETIFCDLMKGMDNVLYKHPVKDMQRWIDYARSYGEDKEMSDKYEVNARRILTIWGPPVDDYCSRIWSGLMRDYYLPRWQHYFEQMKTGRKFDFATWERKWVEETKGLSKVTPSADKIGSAILLIDEASKVK